MYLPKLAVLSLFVSCAPARATIRQESTKSLLSSSGQEDAIPAWDIQSSTQTIKDLANLSLPGFDTSTWYHINASRCTLMGCLLEAQIYKDTELFFSDNLQNVRQDEFLVPWLYRHEFSLNPGTGQHYFLQTNGVTSKADIYLNGHQIADNTVQSGAYGGHIFDISTQVGQKNALVIQVYPTDYNYDFALGFVDWNPYPADNGSGVWRDVTIRQTGSVHLGPLHVTTDLDLPIKKGSSAVVTLKATAQNLGTHEITIDAEALISRDSGSQPQMLKQSWTLGPLESKEIALSTTVENAAIWWPKQWGDQPLYTAQLSCMIDGELSDRAERSFGIRTVTSRLNSYKDTLFSINGYPFQVVGGGYAPDMFLRWDSERFTTQVQYMLDMGLNTVRLEGKMEQPEFYEITDRMGLMVMAGWECCDKWEAWSYNDELSVDPVPVWNDNDYETANASMIHEASMLQSHPSMLAYLVGSDFWPNDRATAIYVNALQAASWQNPIISSAAQRGYPKLIGPSGVKMAGPYDWVPPNYWYDTEPASDRLGAAFSFGSELGAGVGTPELGSLKRFLTEKDMDDIWQEPDKGLYHMSTNVSQFYDRGIYNNALRHRYGKPRSLEEYLLKAQMMDYEATRAEFEGYATRWNAKRPATGLIYWMLNNAWPSLHWNLFDYYLHPAGSYFGTKVGSRMEHVAYDYVQKAVYLINHSLDRQGQRTVEVEVVGLNGKVLFNKTVSVETNPNTSESILDLSTQLGSATDVVFLRLLLLDSGRNTLSRNVYWVAKTIDTLNWDNSTWYYTPVTKYADYTALNKLQTANISITTSGLNNGKGTVILENNSSLPAFFIRLNLVDENGLDLVPVFWSDNYVTVWPFEKLQLQVSYSGSAPARVEMSGGNIPKTHVDII